MKTGEKWGKVIKSSEKWRKSSEKVGTSWEKVETSGEKWLGVAIILCGFMWLKVFLCG